MARMNGERQQMYAARAAFAVERAVATAAYHHERELKRIMGLELPVVEVLPACTCSALPFAHATHIGRGTDEDRERERTRFRNAQPPYLPWRKQ